jgi:hypothetical protein
MSLILLVGLGMLPQLSLIAPKLDTVVFSGEVVRGQNYSHVFHDSLLFKLIPDKFGWTISISTASRSAEDISRLTPPFHSVPNPREIEGWHFRNESNTEPNDGSVNAPDSVRVFVFSPKVGTAFDYPLSMEQFEQIKKDGTGTFTITYLELGNLVPNERAYISRMKFWVRMLISF